MSFKLSPRMEDVAYVPKPLLNMEVAPISSTTAKYARGSAATKLDQIHAEAMDRAAKVKDEEIQQLGSKEIPAKYKIEVIFGPGRTSLGPNACVVQFWESGRRLHGGGDDLMYMCKDRETTRLGCGAIFSSDFVTGPYATCPKCKSTVAADLCVRHLVFRQDKDEDYRITTRALADLLAKYWRQKLDSNSDIYLKFDRTDIRYIAVQKDFGTKRARELKGLSIYPLHNILVDTVNGASLEERIFAFLTA